MHPPLGPGSLTQRPASHDSKFAPVSGLDEPVRTLVATLVSPRMGASARPPGPVVRLIVDGSRE